MGRELKQPKNRFDREGVKIGACKAGNVAIIETILIRERNLGQFRLNRERL